MASAEHQVLLLSIPFSHYAEKVRWALEYYGVDHQEKLLMPGFHMPVAKKWIKYMSKEDIEDRGSDQSPTETPFLVIRDSRSGTVEKVIQGSQKILRYLSSVYSTPEKPSLYATCGSEKTKSIIELETKYDNDLGTASRAFAYYDMIVTNKWASIIPMALIGIQNPVGWLQCLGWLPFSLVFRRIIIKFLKLNEAKVQDGIETCRQIFRDASQILETSPYLGGQSLSAADIAFASLAYPLIDVTHEEGFTYYPPVKKAYSPTGCKIHAEFRGTKAGQHVLRVYAEKLALGYGKNRQ